MEFFHFFNKPASQGKIEAACGFLLTVEELAALFPTTDATGAPTPVGVLAENIMAVFADLPACPDCLTLFASA